MNFFYTEPKLTFRFYFSGYLRSLAFVLKRKVFCNYYYHYYNYLANNKLNAICFYLTCIHKKWECFFKLMAITLYKQQKKNIFFLHSFINLKNVYNIIIKMIYIHMTFVLIFYVYECVFVNIFSL